MRVLSLGEFMDKYYESDLYAKYCSKHHKIDIIDSCTGDVVMTRNGGGLDESKQKAKNLLVELADEYFYARVWNDLNKVGVRIG